MTFESRGFLTFRCHLQNRSCTRHQYADSTHLSCCRLVHSQHPCRARAHYSDDDTHTRPVTRCSSTPPVWRMHYNHSASEISTGAPVEATRALAHYATP